MKITLDIDMDLNTVKEAYRLHYGETGKVLKSNVKTFLEGLLDGDLSDILSYDDSDISMPYNPQTDK